MRPSNQRRLDTQVSEASGSAAEQAVGSISRRSFLAGGLAVGAGATLGPLGHTVSAFADPGRGKLTRGDEAILRFLATAEILETDLWQQYNELGGLQNSELPEGVPSVPYQKALEVLDEDMPTYIHDNTEDEKSHVAFLNAYLESRGGEPVDLSHFLTLPSSEATGARQVKRLTNLMELSVDTSYWTRYRSRNKNPDLGDTFAPAVPALLKGKHPAIPRNNEDLEPEDHIQAIANTAGFHFAFIEQGGTSLYPSLAQRVTDPEVLRVLLSIGPTETMHFQTWHDKAGNAKPLTDPKNKQLVFPNLNEAQPGLELEDTKTNLIMPEPTLFLKKSFPAVSIIRPTNTEGVAMGAVKGLTADGLFEGQTPEFFAVLKELAAAADAAKPKR
jgi:rubrerythrin